MGPPLGQPQLVLRGLKDCDEEPRPRELGRPDLAPIASPRVPRHHPARSAESMGPPLGQSQFVLRVLKDC
jgi:hypothetical protein